MSSNVSPGRVIYTSHHLKGFLPVLSVLKELGLDAKRCLAGTGLDESDLIKADKAISLSQVTSFYQNVIRLSESPLIGLKTGLAYRTENYGVFGFAILSAEDLAQVLRIMTDFGALSFSLFKIGHTINKDKVIFHLSRQIPLDESLEHYFETRDLASVFVGAATSLGRNLPIKSVSFMHNDVANKAEYEAFFRCPVTFNNRRSEFEFSRSEIDKPMPHRDPHTAAFCRSQCEKALDQLKNHVSFVDQVRSILLADLSKSSSEHIASSLNISERTLRRKLKRENSSYQSVLDETRRELAMEYLNTKLSMERISELLGYSESANFSHAFKRWTGRPPQHFRAIE